MVFGQPAVTGGTVTGKVVDGVTKGEIRKATVYAMGVQSSSPQPGALSFRPPTIFSAVTDGEGVFRFVGLAPGKYQLRAEKTGYLAPAGKVMTAVTVVAGQEAAVAELRLVKQGVVAGRVTDAYSDREARKGKSASDHAPVVVDLAD